MSDDLNEKHERYEDVSDERRCLYRLPFWKAHVLTENSVQEKFEDGE
jgi:hypothetical protein